MSAINTEKEKEVDLFKELQVNFDKYNKSKTELGHSGVCPSCGHCPHCGRGGYGTQPYQPYRWPYYVPPYVTWGTITSSDSVQPWSNS